MRVLFRVAVTLLIALPALLVLAIFWAVAGGRSAGPQRTESASDATEPRVELRDPSTLG